MEDKIPNENISKGLELLKAITQKDENTVLQLLKEGVDPNYQTCNAEDGVSSALESAVRGNNSTIVQYLLLNGANPNIEDEEGETALFSAIYEDIKSEIRDLLVKFGADINHRNKNGKSIIMKMLEDKILWGFKFTYQTFFEFLEASDDLNQQNTSGQSLVHLVGYIHSLEAHEGEHHSCLRFLNFLASSGVSINAQDPQGRTSLHSCASVACTEGMEFLFAHGATATLKDIKVQTPLFKLAASPDYPGFTKSFDLLVERGCSVNDTDIYGRTLLYYICNVNNADESAVKHLLKQNANMYIQDINGQTPLHACVLPSVLIPFDEDEDRSPNKPNINKVISLLTECGLSVNQTDNDGLAPLHFAVREDNASVVQQLLVCGACVYLKTRTGDNILHRSTISFEIFGIVFSSLLKKKAPIPIDEQDHFGSTPLHWAVWYSEPDIVKTLIEHGADVNIKDNSGFTPRDLALFLKQKGVYEQLNLTVLYDRIEKTKEDSQYEIESVIQDFIDEINLPTTTMIDSKDEANFYESDTSDTGGDTNTDEELSLTGSEDSEACRDVDLMLPDCPLLQTLYRKKHTVNLLQWFVHLQEHKHSLQTFVNYILCSNRMGLYNDTKENDSIAITIHRIMEEAAKRVAEINPIMACEIQVTGSWNEGTKITQPDEFDFKWIFKYFSDAFEVDDSHSYPLGYVRYRLRQSYYEAYCKYVDENNFLDGRILIRELYTAINQVIVQCSNDISKSIYVRKYLKTDQGSISNLAFRWIGTLYKDILIEVDIVPSITQRGLKLKSVNLNTKMIEKYVPNPEVDVVLKTPDPRFVGQWNTYFRISVAHLEAEILSHIPYPITKGFILLKALKDTLYMPQIFDKVIANDYIRANLSTYVLKTCFLHQLENAGPEICTSKNDEKQHNYNLAVSIDWAKRIMQHLMESTEKLSLPSFFFPSVNLFVNQSMERFNDRFIWEAEISALSKLLDAGTNS